MTHPEYQYLKLMVDILKDGHSKPSRGVHDLKSLFGYQLRFDMRQGFPLLTTKKMPFKTLLHELFWFVSGSSEVEYLHQNKIHYWDGFLHEGSSDLGRVYGVQWRHWRRPPEAIEAEKGPFGGPEFDQLAWAINEIKTNPHSKAIIVNAWNAGELQEMRLPPCHTMFQFDVTPNKGGKAGGKLRMQLYQRSSDVFLGLPFNIAQYAMLLHMVAYVTGLEPRELIISIGNAHLYKNHIDQAKEQIRRKPYPFPQLKISGDVKDIDGFTAENFELVGYEAHEHIKGDLVLL